MDRQCMVGFDASSPLRAAVSAFLFAIETQQTIGEKPSPPPPLSLMFSNAALPANGLLYIAEM
eukprot:scaffold490377_cov21-Prasinocladus_malaysianus.AAC.1